MLNRISYWFDRTILELGREMRLSYLPPLMIYLAAGIQGLTAIAGTWIVKEYFNMDAIFLAALGFWVSIPWFLKMPLGHLVDIIWRFKAVLVFIGAGLIATSLFIMINLLQDPEGMKQVMSINAWFVLSSLLAPVGFVVQDVVADAMTVEAVPRQDEDGNTIDPSKTKLMHITMQTLGRVAIIGGAVMVDVLNIVKFHGVSAMTKAEQLSVYIDIYQLALAIPVISVLGIALSESIKYRDYLRYRKKGFDIAEARTMVAGFIEPTKINWWILGGSLLFVAFSAFMGLSHLVFTSESWNWVVKFKQEIVFIGSLSIILFIMIRLIKSLDPLAIKIFLGTAIIIFIYRAMPGPGHGMGWWMIDKLEFKQQFFAILGLIGGLLTLLGMFIFRRFMAERPITFIVVLLTLLSTILSLPYIGMYYGLHEWTAAHTGGIVDAKFIAIVNTSIESPFGQIAMIPMLAWIAHSAPANLKATYFAVIASFMNLALSLSQLGTKYLNQAYTIKRGDYTELGDLIISVTIIGLVVPIVTIMIIKASKLKSL